MKTRFCSGLFLKQVMNDNDGGDNCQEVDKGEDGKIDAVCEEDERKEEAEASSSNKKKRKQTNATDKDKSTPRQHKKLKKMMAYFEDLDRTCSQIVADAGSVRDTIRSEVMTLMKFVEDNCGFMLDSLLILS